MTEIISDKDRFEVSWIVMFRMRVYVKIDVNPTVANIYLNFRRYYLSDSESKPYLYIIIITAYLMTLKNDGININIPILFRSFLNACIDLASTYNPDKLISVLECNSLDSREITTVEEKDIRECEIDIVEALNFNFQNELPFQYINEYLLKYIETGNVKGQNDSKKLFIPETDLKAILTDFERNLYPFFYSDEYFDIPQSVMAAVAFSKAMKGKECPTESRTHLQRIQEQYGKEMIQHAGHISQQRIRMVSPPTETPE